VTLRTWTFGLTQLETGGLLGHALICPDIHFAGVFWAGTNRVQHLVATPPVWSGIRREIAFGFDFGPLHPDSVIARFVVSSQSPATTVQLLHSEPVEVQRPEDAAATLDAALRSQTRR
jgi:hypothetical protein